MSRTSTPEPPPSATLAGHARDGQETIRSPRLRDEAARERARKAREIVKACAHIFANDLDPVDHGELLYDEFGLPK